MYIIIKMYVVRTIIVSADRNQNHCWLNGLKCGLTEVEVEEEEFCMHIYSTSCAAWCGRMKCEEYNNKHNVCLFVEWIWNEWNIPPLPSSKSSTSKSILISQEELWKFYYYFSNKHNRQVHIEYQLLWLALRSAFAVIRMGIFGLAAEAAAFNSSGSQFKWRNMILVYGYGLCVCVCGL